MNAEQLYQHNLASITAAFPEFAAALDALPVVGVKLLPTQEGSPTGQLWDDVAQQWVTIAHPEHPVADAERIAGEVWQREPRVFCLMGFGLGHFAVAFARSLLPHQRLGIFEPNPCLFKAAMSLVDLVPMLAQPNVHVMIGENMTAGLEHWWLTLDTPQKFAIAPPLRAGYTQHYAKAQFDALQAVCEEMLTYHHVGLATWAQFGSAIGHNDVANLPEFLTLPGAQTLDGCWQDKPAVCVAAGPSLQKNLALLADQSLRARVAVLAVGTVCEQLLAMGIVPDIVTTIDFQALNWTDQFRHRPLDPTVPLVYLHSTWPQTARRWPGPRFVALNGTDLTAWLRTFVPGHYDAGRVQTVAHLNVLLALSMGADPICLVGQDLSTPPDAHHAPGACAQDVSPQEVPTSWAPGTDYLGRAVSTRISHLSMRTVFHQIIREHPERQWINCTEGGLPLAGAPNAPLAHVLAQLPLLDGPPLRHVCGALSRAWHPDVNWAAFEHEVMNMQSQLEGLCQWGHDVVTVQEDAWTLEQAGICEVRLQNLLGAFNLVSVRDFRIIQAMAALPPPEDTPPEVLIQAHSMRLRAYATGSVQHAPVILADLRRALRRLEGLRQDGPAAPRQLVQFMARQCYATVTRYLAASEHIKADDWSLPRLHRLLARLRGELAFQQQQYAVAYALLPETTGKQLRALQRPEAVRAQTFARCMPYVLSQAAPAAVSHVPAPSEEGTP